LRIKVNLGQFLEAQRGDDLVDVVFLVQDGLPVDLTYGADQRFLIQRRIVGAIEILQLLFQIGEARLEAPPELWTRGSQELSQASRRSLLRRWIRPPKRDSGMFASYESRPLTG
jgi:hypothetical protein